MSKDRQETIADIVAWLRRPIEGENAYLTFWRDEIADRIEAAEKREREALVKEMADELSKFHAWKEARALVAKAREVVK